MTTPAGKVREDEKGNAAGVAGKGKDPSDRGVTHEILTPLDLGIDVLRG